MGKRITVVILSIITFSCYSCDESPYSRIYSLGVSFEVPSGDYIYYDSSEWELDTLHDLYKVEAVQCYFTSDSLPLLEVYLLDTSLDADSILNEIWEPLFAFGATSDSIHSSTFGTIQSRTFQGGWGVRYCFDYCGKTIYIYEHPHRVDSLEFDRFMKSFTCEENK